jgi:hypothetical protein
LYFGQVSSPEPINIAQDMALTLGSMVGSFGHPSGRPKKAIFGPRVTVYFDQEATFGAFVDNFGKSSGSPILNYFGEILGVLSYQEKPEDFVTAFEDGRNCQKEAIVSTDLGNPPHIIKLSALPL